MPGSILVSVLGVEDFPSSSQTSSSLSSEPSVSGSFSLKLSMGKTEYQTADRGDFSFPVRSLRESLKLIFFDAEGNEILLSDVKVMEVVERRSWDTFFSLEGIGQVHLKLQFTLNAEEHNRINELREAVLKRKRAELLKSISVGRAADYMGAEKMFMSPSSQRVEQLADFHSKTVMRQPYSFPKEALPFVEEKNIFFKSQKAQQLPNFPSKVDIQKTVCSPQEDSPPREPKITFLPSQENVQLPDFHSKVDDQHLESLPESDTRKSEDFRKEDSPFIEGQFTFLQSQEIQQPPNSNFEVDYQQQENLRVLDLHPPEGLPKSDLQLGEKINTTLPPVKIQQLPDFPSEIDAQQPKNNPEGETQIPSNITKEDSPSREKIITVLPSQDFQQVPDLPSAVDVQQPSNLPDVDTQKSDSLFEEGSPSREKILTPFSPQEIQQLPIFNSQIDAQQPKDFSKEDSLQNDLQVILQEPGLSSEYDSEKINQLNHSVEDKDALASPLTLIEEAIPQLKAASSTPGIIPEMAEPIFSQGLGHKKSPASGVKKMISAFESISSPEPKSWIRRAERADSSRTPWQERLSNVKFGGTLSKSHSTGSLSGLKLKKMSLIQVNVQEEDKHCDVAEIQKDFENKQQNPEPEKNIVSEVIQTKEVVTFHSTVNITEDVNESLAAEAEEHSSENSVSSSAINENGENVNVNDYQQSLDQKEKVCRPVVDLDKIEDPCSLIFHADLQDSTHRPSTEKKSSSKIDFLAYFDAEQCLVGSFGNMVPRHLCITSGGKQLRDAVGRFYIDG